MSNNCKSKRIVGPYGTWSLDELIGSNVRISSMPISNFTRSFDSDQVLTIKDISFRISNEGKAITIIELEECPGMIFTWKDLEILGIVVNNKYNGEKS